MSRVKWIALISSGVIVGFNAHVAIGDDRGIDKSTHSATDFNTFFDKAGISLSTAIERAEQECKGKIVSAEAMCQHQHGTSDAVATPHYKVVCLSQSKLMEVCVDSRNGTVLATHECTSYQSDKRDIRSASSTEWTWKSFRVQKANDLIGKHVENTRGEKVGKVEDLAIDPDRGRVAYVVLSFGGFLGMGEKWFAIPTGAVTLPDHAKHFVLAVDKDRLKNATGFDKDKWPKMADATWGRDVHEFYDQKPYWMDNGTPEGMAAPTRIQKASELIGRQVQNDRGEKIGDIKELVIDPDRWHIVYSVLSFGGVMGVGDKLFAIPMGALQLPGTASFVVLTVDKDRLKNASGFDKSNWPNMADQSFAVSTYEYYGTKPIWRDREDSPNRQRP